MLLNTPSTLGALLLLTSSTIAQAQPPAEKPFDVVITIAPNASQPTPLATRTLDTTLLTAANGFELNPATKTAAGAQPPATFKQATRDEIIKRALKGPKRRATPSPQPPAYTLYSQPDNYPYVVYHEPTRGRLVRPGYIHEEYPVEYETYPPDISQNQALQNCCNFAHVKCNADLYGCMSFEVWYDTSVDLWHCEAFENTLWNNGEFDIVNENANPVIGYSFIES